MCKRFLALMLAFVMFVALLPSTAFTAAASRVTEPLADETISDGSPSSGDTQPPEDLNGGGDPSDSPSEAPGLPYGQDEPTDTEDDIAPPPETDGPENDDPAPEDGDAPDGSDTGIAPIALGEDQTKILKDYFKNFSGEYKLPDGSDWKVIVSEDGLNLSGTGTDGAYIESIKSSGGTVTSVTFASPDWWNNSSTRKAQTLTLTWTTAVNSLVHRAFKCTAATTLYDAEKKLIKGFSANSYFIADNGIFSYDYFKAYTGTYALSKEYGYTYGSDIDGIGGWKIEISDTGHVYLCVDENHKYEAVMTAGSKANNIQRVTTMAVALPGWYTNTSFTTPVYLTLTWGYDEDSKSAGYGKGALYFTTTKQDKIYKQNNKTVVYLPALRFEREDLTNFAKSKLADYAGKYEVSDGTEEYIEIKEDGTVELHMGGDKVLTPLYYVVDNANWREGNEDGSAVTSVVFSDKDWFSEANKKAPSVSRATVTMTWDPENLQFAVSGDVPCYKAGSDEVIRNFTTSIKYTRQETLDEGAAYFSQFVKGTYTLNDGSGWKIEVKDDEGNWKIYTDFGAGEFTPVANPSPVFAQDTTYTDPDSSKGEYGIGGKYLVSVTVPVPGWYTDEGCTQPAVVTLNWKGQEINPMDDHQFSVVGMPIYHKNGENVECKYLAGTFYSDHDREKGQEFLKSYAGTYRPTAAEGKWYIEISDNGTVTVHATDSQGTDHQITNVALDITIDKKIKDEKNPNYGQVTGVTDIKVVVPQWRTVKTNDTLANIMQCEEITFTFTLVAGGSSYFAPSNSYIYADTNDGNPWGVVTKSSQPNYNKPLSTKLYKEDRAYSDANKEAAKKYFADYAGHYAIIDSEHDYYITVTEEGEIYWRDAAVEAEPLPADVQFDAMRDEDGDGEVDDDETEPVPGTISVWLNGYTTGKVSSSSSTKPYYTDGTQRADFTWNDTNEADTINTQHTFKTSGKSATKGYEVGATTQTTFAIGQYYVSGEQYNESFAADGTYETTDAKYKIVIETKDGKTTYTFYRPDLKDKGYPLTAIKVGDTVFLRGLIGKMKKVDVYIIVTMIPGDVYKNFLFTAYEVTYNDLNGKQNNSSSAPTFTLPLMTRFTNYDATDDGTIKNFVVAGPGEDAESGTPYSRLSLALHNIKDGETLYLKDDVEIDFEAKLPDDVGNITIDGQGHTIKRGTNVIPSLAKSISAEPVLMDILTDPRLDPEIVLTALEDVGLKTIAEVGDGAKEEHYTGAILQVGEGDTVTLKNVTIDGEGNWEIDKAKLEEAIELNKDYDIVVTDKLGGHPITVKEGNVVSTESLIKVNGGTLKLDGVTLQNFFAGDGYDDDRHFIDFMSKENGKLIVESETVFKHNASRAGVCIGNTDACEIRLSNCTTMEDNYCYGGNGGLVVAMEGTQVYMDEGTKIINNVAADTNGVFIQLHKKTDGVKDGDNKGTTYARLHMNGGKINNNTGLRGGSYGWGQAIYLYNGGAFEMNGGEIGNNIGAGISSIYQQPSADALKLNAGWIHDNTCSLIDEGMDKDWALDIAIMNIVDIGEDMTVDQNFVVGAAAILGGYASGDEYLTNEGVINGNISVYSYANNEGHTSTVVNNNTINGSIRLENGSLVKNGEEGKINGNITVRGALTGSAGESSFHNEGKVIGNVELAEGAHLYNSGDITGDVTVKSGGTLELNCDDPNHKLHGGTIHGDVTVYPDGLIYADVTPTYIEGTLTFEYEDENDRKRMEEVLHDAGIECDDVKYVQHVHTTDYDVTEIEPDRNASKCIYPMTIQYACKTCGKVVKTEETEPTGHVYYVASTTDATCTTGKIEHIHCKNCSAFDGTAKELKLQVSEPNGHNFEELEEYYIRPTEYAPGRLYYKCTECGEVLMVPIGTVHEGNTKHTFQNDDGSLNDKAAGVTIKAATCTEKGEMTFTCRTPGCEATVTIPIPAKGHTFPLIAADFADDCEVIETVESDCQNAGYITYVPRCETCGEYDESADALKYTVYLPKAPHVLSEWANVDDGFYPCTMEREQERHCTNMIPDGKGGEKPCDKATETRLGGETHHEWKRVEGDEEIYKCSKCGMVLDGLHVDYDVNGGVTTTKITIHAKLAHAPGETVTLWQPSDETSKNESTGIVEYEGSKYWTKSTALGQAVFVGWSTVECGAEPFYEGLPTDANIVTEVTISADNPADVPVYAVWALDRNGNCIPDYDENKVTLKYDGNGNTEGTVPDNLTDLLIGASYPLVTVCDLKKNGNVFAGWSTTPFGEAIPADITGIDSKVTDTAGNPVSRVTWTGGSVDLITSPYKIPKPASGDTVTLYAVYAVADSKGEPAFDDNYYHVEYYAPGATANRHYTVDETKGGLFYTCNDHHDSNSTATLMETKDASVMVYRPGAVLIGWTENTDWNVATHPFITSESDESVLIETVMIPAGSNAKVYAVWAIDENNNGIRDYHEVRYTHTYHLNDRLQDHGKGDTPTLPIMGADGKPTTKSTLQISGVNMAKLPTAVENVLVGQYIPFPDGIKFAESNVIAEADLYSADGKTVLHHYIQIGWSGYPHGVAENEQDARNWIIGYALQEDPDHPGQKKDDNGYMNEDGIFYREIKDPRFINAYVVWALDDDHDSKPDFETDPGGKPTGKYYTVTLELDGGTGGDDYKYQTKLSDGGAFTFPADPQKEGFTFLGWSDGGDTELYKAGRTIRVGADLTFTAQWEEDNPDGGGSGSGDTPPAPPAIDRTEHYGYIIGVTANEVRPEQPITRAEVATILFRLLTDEARQANWSEDSGFHDVKSGDWYNHAVAVLHNLGIVKGDDAGNFNPDASITRAEMAAMMVRFYEKTEGTVLTNRFTDVDETKWYAQEVLLADHYGLMQGDGDRFRPEEPLTRAEAMTVFNRLLGRKPHKDHLHGDMIVWIDNMDKRKWYYADVQEATNSHECGGDVVIDGETYETWGNIKPMRDWTALEY